MSTNPKKMAEGGTHLSPGIPSKRVKVSQDQVVPDTGDPGRTPPVFLRKLRKAAVGTGCDIRLRVSVGGQPAPSLFWYRNNDLLAPPGEKDVGGLWIRDCKARDAGLYTCVASNCLGEAQSSALLAVMDLGEDSETTEDEATEPQVPIETKEGPGGRHQDKAGLRVPAGEGCRMMDSSPDRRATLPGGHDPVVERELMALGSRPPGAQDPTHPGRIPSPSLPQTQTGPSFSPASPQSSQTVSQPTTSLSSHKNSVISHSTQDPSLGGAVVKNKKLPGMFSGASSHTSSSGSSGGKTPKLARAAPKIFDKIKEFEQKVSEVSAGVRSGRSFGRAASCDLEGVSKEEGTSQPDAAASRRSTFGKKRASSLEDKPSYQQRVQSFQNKFTEELARIKKLVGRPNLKKAYSTEQLPQMERQSVGELEPIPPQVVKKLEERAKVLEERGLLGKSIEESVSSRKSSQSHEKGLADQRNVPQREQHDSASASAQPSESKSVGKGSVSMETVLVNQLPGQRSPSSRVTRKSPTREGLRSSPTAVKPLADNELEQPPLRMDHPGSPTPTAQRTPPTYPKGPSSPKELEKPLHHRRPPSPRSPSPTMQRGPSTNAKEPASAYPPKPPRLSPTPISTPSISPLTKRRKGEPWRTSPSLKMTIPTILVEDELMEMEEEEAGEKRERKKTRRAGKKEGRASKTQKKGKVSGKSWESQPMSPETGDDSDDSYMSADEGPAEKPAFERPLGDTIATSGSEVLLKCVITGSPLPIVTWKKSNVLIRSSPSHVVRAEGEQHSLLITQMRSGDAGTYCVTAVNAAGKASCNATLYIKSDAACEQVSQLTTACAYPKRPAVCGRFSSCFPLY